MSKKERTGSVQVARVLLHRVSCYDCDVAGCGACRSGSGNPHCTIAAMRSTEMAPMVIELAYPYGPYVRPAMKLPTPNPT